MRGRGRPDLLVEGLRRQSAGGRAAQRHGLATVPGASAGSQLPPARDTGCSIDRVVSELDRLLESAAQAEPEDRIMYRDRIAAFGAAAIPTLREWLGDPRLGAFAVRTLERIASEPTAMSAALAALNAVDVTVVPESVARDVSDTVSRLTGRRPGSKPASRASPRNPVELWPGSRDVSALELRFHDEMLDIFRLAGEATRRERPDGAIERGYWASYFLRGVRNHGGPDYAHLLLQRAGTTEGFQRLTEEGRLDLTMEALVLRPEYASLFSQVERRTAAHRLAEAGFSPPREGQ
jgi:hypothetical protein